MFFSSEPLNASKAEGGLITIRLGRYVAPSSQKPQGSESLISREYRGLGGRNSKSFEGFPTPKETSIKLCQ